MPASFALQKRLNFLAPLRDFFGHLCLTHAVAANERLSLDAVSQQADSDREAERLQGCRERCLGVIQAETCPLPPVVPAQPAGF